MCTRRETVQGKTKKRSSLTAAALQHAAERLINLHGLPASPLLPIVGATGDWIPRLARLHRNGDAKVREGLAGAPMSRTLVHKPFKFPSWRASNPLLPIVGATGA